ncbi:MAG: hypothetical protein R3288_04545, partial [Woeseiaceae bacterium]|nr:hypothetical protein [Woeseiaceae bacterium]
MIALLLSAVTANVPAWSQAAQLTAEQRRMIDALPPAQRQQALDALRRTQDDNASTGLKPVSEHGSSAIADAAGPALSAFAEDEEPRADAGSRLVITFTPKQTLTTREVESIRDDRFLGRLVGTRAYVLSDTGMLSLMDVEFVPVLGLTEKDIERRLSAEPYLAQFNIDVRILEERLTGVEALEPFGYDLFETAGGELEPPTTGP